MSLENESQADGESLVREVSLEDGGLIIYDSDNEEAWLQADTPVSLS